MPITPCDFRWSNVYLHQPYLFSHICGSSLPCSFYEQIPLHSTTFCYLTSERGKTYTSPLSITKTNENFANNVPCATSSSRMGTGNWELGFCVFQTKTTLYRGRGRAKVSENTIHFPPIFNMAFS